MFAFRRRRRLVSNRPRGQPRPVGPDHRTFSAPVGKARLL